MNIQPSFKFTSLNTKNIKSNKNKLKNNKNIINKLSNNKIVKIFETHLHNFSPYTL